MKASFTSLLTSVTASLAASPPDFLPASINQLIVAYGKTTIADGVVMSQNETQNIPTLATPSRLDGVFAIFMIDSNVPSNTTRSGTTTLLHWAATDLVSSNVTTTLNGQRAHLLTRASNNTSPLAKYIGPAPPPRAPLSHQYTLMIVNHTALTPSNLQRLTTATSSRLGFDAPAVLGATSLGQDVVSATYYNVTNTAKGVIDGGSGSNSTTGNNSDDNGSGGSNDNAGSTGTLPSATGPESANGTSISTSTPSASTTGVISAARELKLSRTATVVICLITVGAGFVGL
ncbi:hypothetical protein BROUX41_001687 [Berkeleyomyces rouxiae]|uniref:uncharacterized protein n=1 Tax=Berkeleyomyces rouxiae TaxID=2035830 RepID=UPI003B82717C